MEHTAAKLGAVIEEWAFVVPAVSNKITCESSVKSLKMRHLGAEQEEGQRGRGAEVLVEDR